MSDYIKPIMTPTGMIPISLNLNYIHFIIFKLNFTKLDSAATKIASAAVWVILGQLSSQNVLPKTRAVINF